MVGKLKSLPGARSLVPFVLLSCGQKSQFLWENEEGETRWVEQAEGGEQGDPLMPYLFPSGIHEPFTAVAKTLQSNEHIFAFLDGVYVVSEPDRTRHTGMGISE